MVWPVDFFIVFMSMDMPMMDVRVVRMLVRDRRVLVLMHMRLMPVPLEVVHMPVVLVMNMGMAVLHGLMRMLVLVPLGQMQPDS